MILRLNPDWANPPDPTVAPAIAVAAPITCPKGPPRPRHRSHSAEARQVCLNGFIRRLPYCTLLAHRFLPFLVALFGKLRNVIYCWGG